MVGGHLLFPTELSSLVIACLRDKDQCPFGGTRTRRAHRAGRDLTSPNPRPSEGRGLCIKQSRKASVFCWVTMDFVCSALRRGLRLRVARMTDVAARRQLSNKIAFAEDRIVRGWHHKLAFSIPGANEALACANDGSGARAYSSIFDPVVF